MSSNGSKSTLRIPPLYAKIAGNRTFLNFKIFTAHTHSVCVRFVSIVDLHLKFQFLVISSMSHNRDVIKIKIKKDDQNMFPGHIQKLVTYFSFLNKKSPNECKEECYVCHCFSKILSDSQEIDHKSKLVFQTLNGS